MQDFATALAGCCLAALVVIVLAVADLNRFEDAEYSPVYEATLRNSYSRFAQSSKRVPLRSGGPEKSEFVEEWEESPKAPVAAGPADAQTRSAAGSKVPRKQASAGRVPLPPASRPAPASTEGVHMAEGNRLAADGRFEEAIAEFRKELAEHPHSALAQHRVADMLRRLGQVDEAAAAYREVLTLNASFHCVHVHIGDMFAAEGRAQQAEAAFAAAVDAYRRQSSEEGPPGAAGRYHLAKFYVDHNRQIEEALVLAKALTTQSPDDPKYWHLLARCLAAADRKAEALAAIDKAKALDPQRAAIYEALRSRLLHDAAAPSGLQVSEPANDDHAAPGGGSLP